MIKLAITGGKNERNYRYLWKKFICSSTGEHAGKDDS